VIYDAEDRPERDQLRRAAAAFARAPSRVACLQATLDFHNRTVNWLTRCFTLEYGTLFRLVLPGLAWWGLPVPLGGTSNHFRTRVLSELGGWDPYNVTEDAELGLRLHAAGYRTAMLPSTTLEEACAFAAPWLRQRTRWMKGYLQTWIVHTRHNGTSRPGRLAVHAVIGSTVLAVALLPALLVALALLPTPLWPDSVVGRAVLATVTAAAVGTFVTGQLIGAWLAPVPVGRGRPARTLAMLPLYALLVSTATYRAGWQLVNRPHLWEKTPHGLSGADTDPAGP
jgi:cellulose synthase/poly-beta-1,6-N-acetylglucosamine synthase-like glycosyltransferase